MNTQECDLGADGKPHRRDVLKAGLVAAMAAGFPGPASAEARRLDFVVPGPPQSGLDQTARVITDAMMAAGLIARAQQFNIADHGGRRAAVNFIFEAERYRNALLVHATPLHLQLTRGKSDDGAGNLVPIAGLFEDCAALVTRPATGILSLADFRARLGDQASPLVVGGGSPAGGMDHLVLLAILFSAGMAAPMVDYRETAGGGAALTALLAGEVDVISVGLGEAASAIAAGTAVAIGLAEPNRLESLPDVPTFAEQGAPFSFRNWRCVYGAPGLTQDAREALVQMMTLLDASADWKTALSNLHWQRRFTPGPVAFTAALNERWRELQKLLRLVQFR